MVSKEILDDDLPIRTEREGLGPHWTMICTIVTIFTMICTIAQTMIDRRVLRSLAAKQVSRNHIMPVRDTIAEATAMGCEMKSHFMAWNRCSGLR